MQFILYSTEETRASAAPPNPQMMAELGKLTDDTKKSGSLVTTGGASSKGTRVRLSGGKFSVTDGPYIEAKELMGGKAVLQLKPLEPALEWANRSRNILGYRASEIEQVHGRDDSPH